MSLYSISVPLGGELPPDINGTIQVISTKPLEALQAELEGIFSFVLYFRNNPDYFSTSLYYAGILSYLQAVQQNPRFARWSVVIYTDTLTLPILQTAFPSSEFPQLVLCVVDWPVYTDSDGLPERNVFRCLRYQCAELFRNQICCIRDADTLFQRVITNCKEKSETLVEFSHSLGTWEQTFIDTWLGTDLIRKPIVIGSDTNYWKPWHSNFPQNIPLRYPIRSSRYMGTNAYVIDAPNGVFAGFINFAADKSTFSDLWTRSVQYLLSRYSIVRGGFENNYERIISNKHAHRFSGHVVGKDEKIILFVFIRYYIDQCFFFTIQYNNENSEDSHGNKPGGFVAEPFVKDEKYNYYPNSISVYGTESTIQYKVIPPIRVCNTLSGMLNPYYIEFILTVAKTSNSLNTDYIPGLSSKNTSMYKKYTISLHDDLEDVFRKFKGTYESWLTNLDLSNLKPYIQQASKYGLQTAINTYTQYHNRNLNKYHRLNETSPNYIQHLFKKLRPEDADRLLESTDVDDLFLKPAGPYTKEEEARFAEQLAEERKTLINAQEKKKQNRIAEMAHGNRAYAANSDARRVKPLSLAFGNVKVGAKPWKGGPLGFGGRHKTRKHHRHMKKRKATRRRT